MEKVMNGKVITKEANGRIRVRSYNSEPSKTDQQFKDECDVNTIMKKFRRTGQVSHLAKHGPGIYADVSQIPDLLECMEVMSRAQQDFDALPSEIRKRFGNSPVELVNFLSDPKNDKEAIALGLKERNKDSLAMEKAQRAQKQNIDQIKKTKTKGAGGTPPEPTGPEGE